MGTKRAFDEELHEFIKHPKHLDYGNKIFQGFGIAGDSPESENDVIVPDMVVKEFETNAPLPLVTGIDSGDDDAAPVPVFSANRFSEFFENNIPSRKLFHYNGIYSYLLNSSPRKEIPIGPRHQANVPEFDPNLARNYINNGGMERFLGICVIPNDHFKDSSSKHNDCKCLDGGSIRCVQQHVKEARLKLRNFFGDEKFIDLGMVEMGEEVACKWSEEAERLFHNIVYSSAAFIGRMFWNHVSMAFPYRSKKELVSYYFNVFILRRRAAQNRSRFLDIDSDEDECRAEDVDDDFVVGDHDSSSEDGGV